MNQMRGKKVLLFAPKFFYYEIYIKEEIVRQGGIVHLYDERDNPSALEKVIFRRAHFLFKNKVFSFYSKVCRQESQFKPDYIVFVNPETVDIQSLQLLKKSFADSKFIIYMWDSCKNKKVKHLFGEFDMKYSFDIDDCKNYNLNFRPLFYLPDFMDYGKNKKDSFLYDISFIGTVHSDRIDILTQMKRYCDRNQLNYFFYLFVPGRLMYVMRWLLSSSFRKFDKKCIHVEALKKEDISKITSVSRCVIDINHPKQTGLTMRTLEMLGMSKKILTTNGNIKKYDFYREENQIVFDRKNGAFNVSELKKEYVEIPKDIYKKYSLEAWINHIFQIKEENYLA